MPTPSKNDSTTLAPESPVAPAPKPKLFRHLLIPVMLLLVLVLGYFYYQKTISRQTVVQTQTVEFWGPAEDQPFYEPLIAQFNSTHPQILVKYQAEAWPDYRQRLQTALISSNGPAAFVYHHTWGLMLQSFLAELPASILDSSTFDSLYYPVNQSWLKSPAGKYLGLPLETDGLALYYNKTLFQGAGLTPPETWAQLQESAKTLTLRDKDKLLRAGIAMGTTNNVEYWPDILGVLLLQNNGDPANPTTAKEADVLTFYTDFTLKDKVWDASFPPSTYAFANEKVAMMLAPASVANEVYRQNPYLNFGIVPLPPPYKQPKYWASYWVGGVNSKSKSPVQEAAWEWLRYLSEKDSLRQFYADQSQAGLIGAPFPRLDMADQLSDDPYAGAYIKAAPYAESWYLCSHTYDNGLNDKIIAVYETVVNAVLSGEPAPDALASVSDEIEKILSSYQGRR